LLGGGGGGSAGASTGPLAAGVGVGAGQPLLTIFDLSGFTARVDVDEIDIVDLAVGQAVTVLVDAYPDAELSGTVRYIALAPQQPPGGGAIFPVTVDLDPTPDDVRLRVGLTASAEVEVQRIDADTVVPTSALLRRGGGEVVYVARDGIAVEVPITVDAIGDDTAAVSGDVTAGDEVVTTGVELVEDGTPIQVGG
jgi:HlyD family secretion protein